MKTRVTFLILLSVLIGTATAQPVNTHRSFTWDGWPANSLNQSNFYSNLGPDNVNVDLKFSFSGTSSPNTASVFTYANQSGRTSSLKVEKNNSEETLTAELKFNQNLEGFNLEVNPYSCDYVDVFAYDALNNPVNVAGAYDISYTDPAPRTGNRILNTGNKDIHIYFAGPVAKVNFVAYKATAPTSNMEFAIGAVSWFNSSDYTSNPDMVNKCEGNRILMILDASTSIDATERNQLIAAIENMVDDLKYYVTAPNYIGFVEFCTQSRLGLDYTAITPASIAPGGAIYDYLHNVTGSGYYSTNALYGGYTNWSQGFKVALDKARLQSPNLLLFFTDGAPNKIYEPNVANNSNLLFSGSWGVNRTSLYADTIKQMGTHILGVGADRINPSNRDFYFKYAIEMVNPEIYDFTVAYPSNLSTADYVTAASFAELNNVLGNLFSTCFLLLPVKFESVQVQQNNCSSNTISWKTTGENGIMSYELEKSTDAVHFESIGTVQANLESNSHIYSFTDDNLNAKNIFYRIKANGNNGVTQYSSVSMIQTRCVNNMLSVWPNPVTTSSQSVQFTNPYKGNINIYVDDMIGRRVFAKTMLKTQPTVQIQNDLNKLSKGLYHLSITDNTNNILATIQFLKQ